LASDAGRRAFATKNTPDNLERDDASTINVYWLSTPPSFSLKKMRFL
jgi:hypothetical protein